MHQLRNVRCIIISISIMIPISGDVGYNCGQFLQYFQQHHPDTWVKLKKGQITKISVWFRSEQLHQKFGSVQIMPRTVWPQTTEPQGYSATFLKSSLCKDEITDIFSCQTCNHTSKKLEILEIKLRQFFWISAKFFAENPELFKFAQFLETTLPIFSKRCTNIA